jgi:hypothetical protein
MNCYGKIYAIKSNQTELIYIGSTIETLNQRFSKHKNKYKRYINGGNIYVSSFKILQYDDAYIELVEDYTCNNKTELTKREGIFLESHGYTSPFFINREDKQFCYEAEDVAIICIATWKYEEKLINTIKLFYEQQTGKLGRSTPLTVFINPTFI